MQQKFLQLLAIGFLTCSGMGMVHAENIPVVRVVPPSQATVPKEVKGLTYQTSPRPNYPVDARRLGQQGRVMVRALVGENGLVEQTWIEKTSGYQSLDKAAILSVRQTKFNPYRENGRAMAVYVLIPIHFALEPSKHQVSYYPEEAKRLGQQGTVKMRVLIGKDGHAKESDIKESSGYESLDQAAKGMVDKMKFKPFYENGEAIEKYALVPIRFTLDTPIQPAAPAKEPQPAEDKEVSPS